MRIFLQFLDLPKENTEFWLFVLKYKSDGSRRQVVKMIAVVKFFHHLPLLFSAYYSASDSLLRQYICLCSEKRGNSDPGGN